MASVKCVSTTIIHEILQCYINEYIYIYIYIYKDILQNKNNSFLMCAFISVYLLCVYMYLSLKIIFFALIVI